MLQICSSLHALLIELNVMIWPGTVFFWRFDSWFDFGEGIVPTEFVLGIIEKERVLKREPEGFFSRCC